jgi:hypothetical protein
VAGAARAEGAIAGLIASCHHNGDQIPQRPVQVVLADLKLVIIHADVAASSAAMARTAAIMIRRVLYGRAAWARRLDLPSSSALPGTVRDAAS